MKAFKTDDPDFNGNCLTGDWGGNGDPYLTIIEADTEGNIKGLHSVRVAFSGGNFPSDMKCMVGMLVNMIKRYEPYINDDGVFNEGKYILDLYKKKESVCDNFMHEAARQANVYENAEGKHKDVFMLGCAIGIKWGLKKIQEILDEEGDEDMLKLTLRERIWKILRTE